MAIPKQEGKRSKRSKGVKLGSFQVVENMERETRIELATNSLEGCDSTIELLPLSGGRSFHFKECLFARSTLPGITACRSSCG